MKKRIFNGLGIAMAAVLTFVVAGCSEDHEHSFSSEWTKTEFTHYHAATCEHSDKRSNEANHDWSYTYNSVANNDVKTCSVCGYQVSTLHNHTNEGYKTTETTHQNFWQCCGTNIGTEASHTWDHEAYQYSDEYGMDIRTCTVCAYVSEIAHTHSLGTGTVTTAASCFTKGEMTYTCSSCSNTVEEDIPALYSSPVDYNTGKAATKSSTYVCFGVYPKSIKDSSVTVNKDPAKSFENGNLKFYQGEVNNKWDGEWYIEGNTANEYYKVEPIRWRIITTDYNNSGKVLLVADNLIEANVPYYLNEDVRDIRGNNVEPNNYRFSTIRAYLNGSYEDDDPQATTYKDKGFLQTAFLSASQDLIAETVVDNSTSSTTFEGDTYTCANTTDKIFLLSLKDVTSYDFAVYDSVESERVRVATKWAESSGVETVFNAGLTSSRWWLRSPSNTDNKVRVVDTDGKADKTYSAGEKTALGIVPALTITLPNAE